MEFNRKDGLIWLGDESDPDAYITYTLDENKVMSITHTVVKKELGGSGIAGKITDEAVNVARENGYKILPICSYAVKYFEKNEELKDLLA